MYDAQKHEFGFPKEYMYTQEIETKQSETWSLKKKGEIGKKKYTTEIRE